MPQPNHKISCKPSCQNQQKGVNFNVCGLEILRLHTLQRRMELIVKHTFFLGMCIRLVIVIHLNYTAWSRNLYNFVPVHLQSLKSMSLVGGPQDCTTEGFREFLKHYEDKDVLQQLTCTMKALIAENQQKLKLIVKYIIFCGKQSIALGSC